MQIVDTVFVVFSFHKLHEFSLFYEAKIRILVQLILLFKIEYLGSMENGGKNQQWKRIKIKPASRPNSTFIIHPDYFLIKSVHMDVLIKKNIYDTNYKHIAQILDTSQ